MTIPNFRKTLLLNLNLISSKPAPLFENLGILNLSSRYLKNYLSYGLETWPADRAWWVDYLIKFKKKNRLIFLELLVFENLGILNLSAISKTIWARGLNLGQLRGDDEYITWLNFKKCHLIFPELWPFENLGFLNLSARYLDNYLSDGLSPGSADRGWWVDYLSNFTKKKKNNNNNKKKKIRQFFPVLWAFENFGI